MKILIYSLGKSGTTALMYSIINAYKKDLKQFFEPANLKQINYKEDDLIVKSVYANRWNTDQEFFHHYDKLILLVRNPLDRIVSYLLYLPYNGDGFSDDRNMQEYIDYLKSITNDRRPPSIIELDSLYVKITKRPSLIKVVKNQSKSILQLAKAFGSQFLHLKYEDFVDGELDMINNYLSFNLNQEVEVENKFKRTKRSGKYNDYLKFMSETEYNELYEELNDFFSYFNYDLSYRNLSSSLESKNTFNYVIKVVNEYREKNYIPLFEDGVVKVKEEGDYFDRARREFMSKNYESSLDLLKQAKEINPRFEAIEKMRLKIEKLR
ncbi:MAG: hypothetical protein RLO81_07575 [Fulvivirga sp.]|uniref:hypothetical protein n=1 Tax=Fulvivirga sp. TaxID=1931237 RepID=UPI0032ECC621